MQHSEDIKDLVAALVKAKSEFTPFTTNNKVDAGNKTFEWADLRMLYSHTEPFLLANGLVCIAGCEQGDKISLTTTLMHTSGQWIKSTMTLAPKSNSPTDCGAVITYMRRYAYVSLLGLAPDEELECEDLRQSLKGEKANNSSPIVRENRMVENEEEKPVKPDRVAHILRGAESISLSKNAIETYLQITDINKMTQKDFGKAYTYLTKMGAKL